MADSVEKEKLRCGRCLHEHDDACSDNSKQANDVHPANDVEDNEAWALKRLTRKCHSRRSFGGHGFGFVERRGDTVDMASFDRNVEQSTVSQLSARMMFVTEADDAFLSRRVTYFSEG